MLRNQILPQKALMLLGILLLGFSACLKDLDNPTTPNDTTRARIEITDAPIDDPNVKGVFITVVDIKVDGVSWSGFSGKTTFDLLTYQQGLTKLLGEGELDAKTYTEVVLILDTDTDANGDSPGCYIKDAQGLKSKLSGGNQMVVKAKGSFITKIDATTDVIIDIDLRKSIVYQSGSSTMFQFVSNPELFAAVRLADKANTASILGDCTDGVSGSAKIIVYAYKSGEYNPNEKFPQGTSQVQFKNAVTSSVVATDGSLSLSYLEKGNYELHFISYQQDLQGQFQAKGELQLNVIGPVINLLQINLEAQKDLNLDVVVTGIQFF